MKKLFYYFTNLKPYIFLLVISFIIGYFAWKSAQNLPKPETIPALFKYYFQSPGDYLTATGLFLVVGLLFIFLSVLTGYMTAIYWNDFNLFINIFCIIFTVALLILGIYFATYFTMLLFVLVLIAAIAYVFINNNSRR